MLLRRSGYGDAELPRLETDGEDELESVLGDWELGSRSECRAMSSGDELKSEVAMHGGGCVVETSVGSIQVVVSAGVC